MKSISSELDVSEALLYKYFPTKEALLEACAARINEVNDYLYRTLMADMAASDLDIKKKIAELSKIQMKFHIENDKYYKTQLILARSPYSELAKNAFDHNYENNLRWLAETVGGEVLINKVYNYLGSVKTFWAIESSIITSIRNAVKRGVLPDDDRTYELLYHILFKGLIGGKIYLKETE